MVCPPLRLTEIWQEWVEFGFKAVGVGAADSKQEEEEEEEERRRQRQQNQS